LVVLRGWADIDGIRVRVLRTDNTGADAEVVVASAEEAGHVVIAWLSAAHSATTSTVRYRRNARVVTISTPTQSGGKIVWVVL
jgi:hypothetical protein